MSGKSMMKVLVGTPAGRGDVSTQYLYSFIAMMGDVIRNGVEPHLYTLSQESLLPRGRNHLAQVAMRGKFDKLFFIDADSGWTATDFLRLCGSPFPIVAGVVPLKVFPITLNYLPFKHDEKYFTNAARSLEGTERMRLGHNATEIPVAFTGTAFMCIDKQVLFKMAETEDTYQYPNPYTGELETHWDFFGAKPLKNTYYSEDWVFCHKARELGYDIRINTDVRINHVGNYTYRINPTMPVDMAPEIFRPLMCSVASSTYEELALVEKFAKETIKAPPIQTKPLNAPKAEAIGVSNDSVANTQ